MATGWIKMRTDLADDPRVVRIVSACDADTIWTIGALHCIWTWFDLHSRDGSIEGVPPAEIDRRVGKVGFAKAMESVGWLVVVDNCLTIPDFHKHNGGGARRRATDSVRKSSARDADNCPHDMRTERGRAADKVRPRERVREEKKKRTVLPACASGESESSAPSEEGPDARGEGSAGRQARKGEDLRGGWGLGWGARGEPATVREALRRLGMRNPAFEALASFAERNPQRLTVAIVDAEARMIRTVAIEEGIRSPAGLLAYRLAERIGIKFGDGGGLTTAQSARLAQIRLIAEGQRSASIGMNGKGSGIGHQAAGKAVGV